jgi:hypothetical protein
MKPKANLTYIDAETFLTDLIERLENENKLQKTIRFFRRIPSYYWPQFRSAVTFAKQRVKRGWDERAYWDTGYWLAQTLGEVLEFSSTRLHGHPVDTEYEDWQTGYAEAGKKLLSWVQADENLVGTEQLEEAYKAAQEALAWVADNLGSLWD